MALDSDASAKHDATPGGKKTNDFFSKYKWWIIGGLAVIAILIFWIANGSASNASGTTSSGTTVKDVGVPGPRGATGAKGAKGNKGERGKKGERGVKGKRGKPGKDEKKDKKKKHHSSGDESTAMHPALRLAAQHSAVAAHNARIMR